MIASYVKILETAIRVVVELLESVVEISSDLVHIFRIYVRVIGVCVAQSCADRLVHKQNVVILRPGVFVASDIIGTSFAFANPEGAELHQITQLTSGTWSSVEPDDGGDCVELFSVDALLAIEDES